MDAWAYAAAGKVSNNVSPMDTRLSDWDMPYSFFRYLRAGILAQGIARLIRAGQSDISGSRYNELRR
jgi:hypothetical protein